MSMKIEMYFWITLYNFRNKFKRFRRSQYAQCIRKHNSFHRLFRKKIEILKYIFFGITHAITPVFKINIGVNTFFSGQYYYFRDFSKMLLRFFLKLMG